MRKFSPNSSRRDFLTKAALAAAGIALVGSRAVGKDTAEKGAGLMPEAKAAARPICIFSKQLHWLGYDEMAETAARIGFDGIDLTVRPNGHVLPERVAEDLPKAVAAAQKAGLTVPMITTDITHAPQPYAERVLKTASQQGVKYYRMGWLPYQDSLSIQENLERYKAQFRDLATLNKKYGIHGGYQNHTGTDVGAPVWDLWELLQGLDPQHLGSQYDIKHATAEGGYSWPLGFKLIHPYIRTIDLKDFMWVKKDGKLEVQSVPLGEGMVDFQRFFSLIKAYKVQGPISLHLEYPLGGAENGAKKLTIPGGNVIAAMQQDLTTLRGWLKEAGLS